MYSLRSRKVKKKSDDDDVATKQDTSGVTTERDADTTRNEPSTRTIKRPKKGENSAANSSKKKEKKTGEESRRRDKKKNQNIDKSYKRKWDESTVKSEIINKRSKAKEDEDMMKSESVDKGNTKKDSDVKKSKSSYDRSKINANEDMKKSESVDLGKETKKDDDMKKPQNIDKGNPSKDSNENRKRKLVEDTNHQKKNDVGDTSNDSNKNGKRNLVEDTNHRKKNDVGDTSNESNEDYITTMPNEILFKIFSNLPVEDLMNVQSASPKLQAAAHDASVWRDFTLKLFDTNPLELQKMPSVRNIEGYTTNSTIKTILDNVIDLRKLDCVFYPGVSASQMEQIVNKYKKLESITVNLCSSSALECLQVLKSSKTLQEIKLCFCGNHKHYRNSTACSVKFPKLSYTFVGVDNFPALENLEVKYSIEHEQILNDSGVVSCLAKIMKRKSQQLKYLNISAKIDASILKAVNQCTKLKELKIQLSTNRHFREFGINRLTELRNLHMSFDTDCSVLLTMLSESFKQGSWSYLTNATFIHYRSFWSSNVWNWDVDLLKSIIDNMKALKSLHFKFYNIIINESQLSNIGDLESLEDVRLYGVSVTNIGISYLSNCRNLKRLALRTNLPLENHCVAEMLCSMEKLEFFDLKPRTSGHISLWSRQEIREWISSVLPTVK